MKRQLVTCTQHEAIRMNRKPPVSLPAPLKLTKYQGISCLFCRRDVCTLLMSNICPSRCPTTSPTAATRPPVSRAAIRNGLLVPVPLSRGISEPSEPEKLQDLLKATTIPGI